MHSFGENPEIQYCKICPKKLRTSFYGAKDMLNRLDVTHECYRQIDWQREMTDINVANDMLHYFMDNPAFKLLINKQVA